MKYCVECGTKLTMKYLKNEGDIPYCPTCEAHRFPIFNTAVIMMVIHRQTGRVLLIKQYGRPFYILVAGYVNRGENAEETCVREVLEETGLKVAELEYRQSRFFERSNSLMLNFAVYVDSDEVKTTEEVDSWQWFTYEEARKNIKDGSLAEEFLCQFLNEKGL